MKSSSLLNCTARPTALHAHWSNLAGGCVLVFPMVNIEGTIVWNPWMIDVAHCLDTTNMAVWHGNVSRLLGTQYHAVGKEHHLSTILTEIAGRKPGRGTSCPMISPFEFPSEVASYLRHWAGFTTQFTWPENKNYVRDATPVWVCVCTHNGGWRLQQIRGTMDPAYANPANWVSHQRPPTGQKRNQQDQQPKKKARRSPLASCSR